MCAEQFASERVTTGRPIVTNSGLYCSYTGQCRRWRAISPTRGEPSVADHRLPSVTGSRYVTSQHEYSPRLFPHPYLAICPRRARPAGMGAWLRLTKELLPAASSAARAVLETTVSISVVARGCSAPLPPWANPFRLLLPAWTFTSEAKQVFWARFASQSRHSVTSRRVEEKKREREKEEGRNANGHVEISNTRTAAPLSGTKRCLTTHDLTDIRIQHSARSCACAACPLPLPLRTAHAQAGPSRPVTSETYAPKQATKQTVAKSLAARGRRRCCCCLSL